MLEKVRKVCCKNRSRIFTAKKQDLNEILGYLSLSLLQEIHTWKEEVCSLGKPLLVEGGNNRMKAFQCRHYFTRDQER